MSVLGDSVQAPSAFDRAVTWVLAAEGVHNVDQGGDTAYGIAQKFHPDEKPWPPSRERAIEIYREEYWDEASCDQLPPALAIVLFDTAVNQGVNWAIRQLQAALGVTPDGVVGLDTIAAAKARDLHESLAMVLAHRAQWYATDPADERLGLMARLFRLQAEILEYFA